MMQNGYTNDKEFFEKISVDRRNQYIEGIMGRQQLKGKFTPYSAEYQRIQSWKYKDFQYHYHITQVSQNPKAVLIYIHGLNSHGGVSGYLAKIITKQAEVNMAALDLKNFGRSRGRTKDAGFVESFDDLVDQAQAFSDFIRSKYSNKPKLFIGGLSMGGEICFKVGLRNKHNFQGVIFLAPALRDNPRDSPILKKFTCLGYYFPRLRVGDPDLSKDTKYDLDALMRKDPYLTHDSLFAGVGYQIMQTMGEISNEFAQFELPYIIFQAGIDKYVDPFAPIDLQRESKSKDKTTIYYKDMWHSIEMEEEVHQIGMRISQWLKQRI